MKKIAILALILFLTTSVVKIKPSAADDVITVGHGDQFILTLRKDRLIDVQHTLLLTSDITVSGVFNETQSIEGALVGEPTFIVDQGIEGSELLWKVEDGVTRFNIIINTTVTPFKFKGVTISYTLNDTSFDYHNGSWYFRKVFSSSSGALAPPEIVVKVPKPSQFEDLSFDEMIPIPHVFIEEGPWYTLVWKSEVFMVGNTSVTLVRLEYSAKTNWPRIFYYVAPPLITFVLGIGVKIAWDLFREKRKRLRETGNLDKTSNEN